MEAVLREKLPTDDAERALQYLKEGQFLNVSAWLVLSSLFIAAHEQGVGSSRVIEECAETMRTHWVYQHPALRASIVEPGLIGIKNQTAIHGIYMRLGIHLPQREQSPQGDRAAAAEEVYKSYCAGVLLDLWGQEIGTEIARFLQSMEMEDNAWSILANIFIAAGQIGVSHEVVRDAIAHRWEVLWQSQRKEDRVMPDAGDPVGPANRRALIALYEDVGIPVPEGV